MENQETTIQKQNITSKKITDPELIKKYNAISLYVPPHEDTSTYDSEMLDRGALTQSKEIMGEIRPIEVAVWEDDPEKNSPNALIRIHLRIINGRHRYINNIDWKREYYDLSSEQEPVLAYYNLRHHFDMQKKSKPEERTALIEQVGEYLMKQKGIPMTEVCNEIVKMWVPQGFASEVSIRNSCPSKFKDQGKILSHKDRTWEQSGKDTTLTKKAKEIAGEKLKQTEDKLLQEIKNKEELERTIVFQKQTMKEKLSALQELQKQYNKIKSLETTVSIENIKIHAKVDAVFGKLIVEKAK